MTTECKHDEYELKIPDCLFIMWKAICKSCGKYLGEYDAKQKKLFRKK